MLTLIRRALVDRLAPAPSWGRRLPEQIDPESLAAGLAMPATGGLLVRDVDHGTSLRSRLILTGADGAEVAMFAKNTPVTFGPGLLDGFARLCEREARFYRDLAPSIPDAPQAVLSEWDPRTGRSTVVLTDLGAEGFSFRPAAEACTPPEAAAVMVLLGRLHATGRAGAGLSGALSGDPIFDLDGARMRRMSRLATRTVGKPPRSLAELVPEPVLRESRILRTHAREYADVLAGFPQAFIHNDTHRGNIGFAVDAGSDPAGVRAVLIDWQNCGWGPALKDVAYFLATSVDPEVRRQHERDLLDLYLRTVEDSAAPIGQSILDPDDAWFAYRVLTITGYVAAAVTALFRDRLQAAANAEQGLLRATAAVQDLDAFAALREQIEQRRSVP